MSIKDSIYRCLSVLQIINHIKSVLHVRSPTLCQREQNWFYCMGLFQYIQSGIVLG